MKDKESMFQRYLDDVINFNGMTGRRKVVWSIPRVNWAREVFMDALERANDTRSQQCDQ